MNTIIEQLQQNLELLNQQAIEADLILAELKTKDLGKFTAIFEQGSVFDVKSNRFQPYVIEINEAFTTLKTNADENNVKTLLENIVKKMDLMFKTLNKFQKSISQDNSSLH